MAVMKSWVAAPSLFCAGSRVVHAPEYPELSRTVIEPPAVGAAVDAGAVVAPALDGLVPAGVELVPEGVVDVELLHAAAVRTVAAAPARQAVRIDMSRNLTAFTYS
jgi:hypothetical protein